MWLKSDNIAGVDATILRALADSNEGNAETYGDDPWSRQLDARFSELFEHAVQVFPVASGTAANALSLSSLAGPLDLIACHEDAHPMRNESGATTFFSGGASFVPVKGGSGKVNDAGLVAALDQLPGRGHGALSPQTVTVTQLSEAGTAYRPEEIRAIGQVAEQRGLAFHMDGARFANAVAGLQVSPGDITWRCGVDVLSFGATKNGTMYSDAVVFFDRDRAVDFGKRLKRAGHALSKTRFMAAQLLAYLTDGRWLANARYANSVAAQVAATLAETPSCDLLHPVEGNIVFAALDDDTVARLAKAGITLRSKGRRADGRLYFRLVTSFMTPAQEVERFAAALKR